MKSTKSYRTGKPDIDRVLSEIARDINILCDSVNQPQQSVGYGATGKSGDLRLTFDDGGYAYIEGYGRNGWLTTFTGVMKDKPARGRPNPHFPYLEVDNLYAKTFTVAMTTARNGNEIMSDFGIVESMTNDTITFKDQSNLNLCSFAQYDTCEVRHIKADKSANIKKINFTVTAVSGRTVSVSYSASDKVSVGDIVVRIGNTTTAARQKAIYFSTADNTNVPYIDLYAGTTGYTFGTPKASFGDMTHIADADFNSVSPYFLTGDGIYCANAYIKGKLKISSNADIIGLTFPMATYSTGDLPPGSPVEGDWFFCTDTTPTPPYLTNTWYRYSGAAWAQMGLQGTYIDGTGIYTGTVVASQVIAGTLTGFTIQTAASGKRVVIDTNNVITFWNAFSQSATIGGGGDGFPLEILSGGKMIIQSGVGATDNIYITAGGTISFSAGQGFAGISYSDVGADATGTASGLMSTHNSTYTHANIANGQTAYGWGNHASAGYLTAETDPTIYAWAKAATKPSYTYSEVGADASGTASGLMSTHNSIYAHANIANGQTAYGWGNHASAGYIVKPADSGGWLYNDGFGGLSWTAPTYSEVGAAAASHGNEAHSSTFITSSALSGYATQTWTSTAISDAIDSHIALYH